MAKYFGFGRVIGGFVIYLLCAMMGNVNSWKRRIMDKKGKPSSLSILSAVIFIVLLIALAVYSGQKNDKKDDKKTSNEQTSYTLKSNDSISVGPADAKVTFTEYYDYQCPACHYFAENVLSSLESKYEGKVKFVFKQFPLNYHENAEIAAKIAVCANDQGKFLDYHNSLNKNYDKWMDKPELIETYAKEIGLDMTKVDTCKNSKEVANFVARDIQDGTNEKLEGTPTIIINGEKIAEIQDLTFYEQKIDTLLSK